LSLAIFSDEKVEHLMNQMVIS